MRRLPALLLSLCALAATPALAQRSTAEASLTVLRSLTVRVQARLRFGRVEAWVAARPVEVLVQPQPLAGEVDPEQPRRDATGRSPAIAVVTGEPGRVYRVLLPREIRTTGGDVAVTRLTLWSAGLGDITRSRTGVLDARGRDVLRVGGVLTAPQGLDPGAYAAHVPLQIAYE